MSEYVLSEKESKVIRLIKGVFALMIILIHVDGNGINLANSSVVFEHPYWFQISKRILSDSIPCCAVPGFFLISSILLYRKPFKWFQNIKKKIKTLIVPYFIVNTFWIIFYAIAQSIPMLKSFFSDPNKLVTNWGVLEYLDAYLGFGTSNGVCLLYAPFWFLRDLFVLNILAVLIKKTIDYCPLVVSSVLIIVIVFNINTHLFFLGRNSLVFFCLGYYVVKYRLKICDLEKIGFINSLILYVISIALEVIFSNYISHFFVICAGLVFWYMVTNKICNAPPKLLAFFDMLSHYNFSIFLIHYIPSAIIIKAMFVVMPKKEIIYIFEYFISIIAVLLFSILISWGLEKYTPKIFHILTGR